MCMTDEQFTAYTLQATMLLAKVNGAKPLTWRMLHGDVHELYMIGGKPVVLSLLCVADPGLKAAAVAVHEFEAWAEVMSSVAFGSQVVRYFRDSLTALAHAQG